MGLLSWTWAVAAALSFCHEAICAPTPGRVPMHSLPSVPAGWTRGRRAHPAAPLKLYVALAQEQPKLLEDTILAVSTPGDPRYGRHLNRDEAKQLTRPASHSTDTVLSWLAEHNVRGSSVHVDGDWLTLGINAAQAEALLQTEFYLYESADNDRVVRTLQYSLPGHIAPHVRMVQPTTRFGVPQKMRSAIYKAATPEREGGDGNGEVDDEGPPPPVATSSVPLSHIHVATPQPPSCNSSMTPACLRELYGIGDARVDSAFQTRLGVVGFLEVREQLLSKQSKLLLIRLNCSNGLSTTS